MIVVLKRLLLPSGPFGPDLFSHSPQRRSGNFYNNQPAPMAYLAAAVRGCVKCHAEGGLAREPVIGGRGIIRERVNEGTGTRTYPTDFSVQHGGRHNQ